MIDYDLGTLVATRGSGLRELIEEHRRPDRVFADTSVAGRSITYLFAEGRVEGEYDRAAFQYCLGRAGGLVIARCPGQGADLRPVARGRRGHR